MDSLLLSCYQNLSILPCCHTDGRTCNCSYCWKESFYHKPDTYNCEKKLNYYVLNYGPSYASEIYHYLSTSQILESFAPFDRKIKILSLGCGFAPDLLAIERYVADKQLPLLFEYHGVDQSSSWQNIHYSSKNSSFIIDDIMSAIDFNSYDLIFIVKLFSTIFKHNDGERFLKLFASAVQTQLKDNGLIIFNDINSVHMGRDYFHLRVNSLFRNVRQFFFSKEKYWAPHWVQLQQQNIVFNMPFGVSFSPLPVIGNTVVFEYRK